MKIIIGLAFLVFSVVAFGHHSSAHYSEQKQELRGELVEVHWSNPHVGFTVSVTNDEGKDELWRVEGRSNLFSMEGGGVTPEMFRVGEQVIILGSASVRRSRDMLATNLLLANGTEVLLDRDADPEWSEDNFGRFDPRVSDSSIVDALSENRGIFRVWSWAGSSLGELRDFPFLDSAIRARAEWDPIDNFLERCEPQGMPGIMMHPHAVEFVDRGSEIELTTQIFDQMRILHMDLVERPKDVLPSRLGYSIGHWEGETLIVTTTHINWPYFDGIGTPQSEAIELVERFTVSEDQTRLYYSLTITDQSTFSVPAVYERNWLAVGATIRPYACQVY